MDSVAKSKNVQKAIVGKRLKALDKRGIFDKAVKKLELDSILEREFGQLSGGEL